MDAAGTDRDLMRESPNGPKPPVTRHTYFRDHQGDSMRHTRATALLAAGAAFAAAGLIAVPAVSSAATSDVAVTWTVTDDWTSGFQVAATVTNNTNAALSPWKVTVPYVSRISSIWDAVSTPVSGGYSIVGAAWTTSIPAHSSLTFGLVGARVGASAAMPASCSVVGLTCSVNNGVVATPSPMPSPTPTPTLSPTPTPTPTSTPTPTPTPTPSPTTTGSAAITVALSTASSWDTGRTMDLTITNSGTRALTGWTVSMPWAGSSVSVWNATGTLTGGNLSLTSVSWNGALAPGATATVGFNDAGPLVMPTSCTSTVGSCRISGSTASPSPTPSPTSTAPIVGVPGNVLVAPYVDMGLWPTADLSAMARSTGVGAVTAAFVVQQASAACVPSWGGYADYAVGGNGDFLPIISAFQNAGGNVIVSFGGASGSELAELCTSDSSLLAAYKKVIDRYSLSRIDFDIEGSAVANPAANQRRARAVAQLQRDYAAAGKVVQVSLTLPVMPDGLDANGLRTLKEFAAAGVNVTTVNVMAMDYGAGFTSMGAHAISAAQGTAAQMKTVPAFAGLTNAQLLTRVGITPMLGQNDVPSEVFGVQNAKDVAAWSKANGIGLLAWWEMTRDRPCGGSYQGLSLCSGVPSPQWAYAQAFVSSFRG
jgi:hypothetical protein